MVAYILPNEWQSFWRDKVSDRVEDDPVLFNQYGVIVMNPKKHPHVKYQSAKNFVDWLLSVKGQQAIAEFKINSQQLFYPNAKEQYAIKKSNTC